MKLQKITPYLWFDHDAEKAAHFYVSLLKNAKITKIIRIPAGTDKLPNYTWSEGSVMEVNFTLDGQDFTALNGGSLYSFTNAVSFVINCEDQAEVDHFWHGLLADGGKEMQCGWLNDQFGVCWQVVPTAWLKLMSSPDPAIVARVFNATMGMGKIIIANLEAAAAGK